MVGPATSAGCKPGPRRFTEGTAAAAGLTTGTFNSCLVGGKYRQAVANNTVEAGKLNIDNIPTIFVDDVRIVGAQPLDVFVNAIEAELAK